MPRSVGAVFVYSCFLLAFTACVDNEPIIDEARASVVVDYSGETVQARLSVFANVKSDLDLAAEIRLVNEEADLEWSCRELTMFSDASKNDWAGCAAFVAPEGDAIPKGRYVLTYEDTCEREGEIVFVVDYPDALLERIHSEEESTPSDDTEADADDTEADLTDIETDAGDQVSTDGVLEQKARSQAEAEAADEESHVTQQPLPPGKESAAVPKEEATAQQESEVSSASDRPNSEDEVATSAQQASEGAQDEVVAQGDEEDETSEGDEEMSLEVRRKKPAVFKSKTIDEAEAILGKGAQKKIALYSADRQLLYFGEQEDDTLSQYKEAAFCKMCLCTQDDAVICVFAETPLVHKQGK